MHACMPAWWWMQEDNESSQSRDNSTKLETTKARVPEYIRSPVVLFCGHEDNAARVLTQKVTGMDASEGGWGSSRNVTFKNAHM